MLPFNNKIPVGINCFKCCLGIVLCSCVNLHQNPLKGILPLLPKTTTHTIQNIKYNITLTKSGEQQNLIKVFSVWWVVSLNKLTLKLWGHIPIN